MRDRKRVVGRRLLMAAAAVLAVLDKEDVWLLAGLALVSAGLWLVSHAASLITPGVVLLWIYLPARPPLIESTSTGRRPSA